jgi:hypothetical protein
MYQLFYMSVKHILREEYELQVYRRFSGDYFNAKSNEVIRKWGSKTHILTSYFHFLQLKYYE